MDLSIDGMWSGRIEEQCEKMDEHHTPLSKQQLVQLIRSLILVEQVFILAISPDHIHKMRYSPPKGFCGEDVKYT